MNRKDIQIRRLLWLYFFLVIFEGALRKWLLPGLAQPLLVARDPVCIVILLLGFSRLTQQPWALGFIFVGIISIPLALAFGHGNLYVTLYGARIWLLHFPLIFLFPTVFDRDDIWKFGKAILIISIPMTCLLALQFYLPYSHQLNVGIGGEGTSVFSGAAGHHRSSGTFSFTNGLSSFYAISGAFFAAYLVGYPKPHPRFLWLSGICIAIAIPFTISRALAFNLALVSIFTIGAAGISPRLLGKIIPATILLTILIFGISRIDIAQEAFKAFSTRWEQATANEGQGEGVLGVIKNRVFGYGIGTAFGVSENAPIFGYGSGLGTQAGARLATGERGFLIAEGEIGRLVGELGTIIGLVVIGLRLWLAVFLAIRSFLAIKSGVTLPWILGGTVFVSLIMGNSGQPTSLGFIILGVGFLAAALNDPQNDNT